MCGVIKICKNVIFFQQGDIKLIKSVSKDFTLSKNPEKYHGFHKSFKQHNCFNIDKKKSVAPNLHIRMISERSCDGEDWNNLDLHHMNKSILKHYIM